MAENNYIECRNKSDHSAISNSGIISDSVKIENYRSTRDISELEQLLQYKESIDEILKRPDKHNNTDDDNNSDDFIFGLEFPFSDNEQVLVNRKIQLEELAKKFDRESSQFSKEYLEILEEIDTEKEPTSLPCSTCSLCSSCTTDTWERLKIDQGECLAIKPIPLEPDTIEDLRKLNNRHNELINNFLSVDAGSDDSDKEILNNRVNEEAELKGQKEICKSPTKKIVTKKKQKRKGPHDQDSDKSPDCKSTNSDDFFISPPDYDYFCDPKSQEIHFQKDTIPWNVKEWSRKKCTNWLNRNCH